MPGVQFFSRDEFKSYIKRQLGHPVINVEIADEQLDDIIFDSVQTFQRYNYSEGSYPDYLVFTLSAGVSQYDLSGTNIEDIYDLVLSVGPDGINTLFSPTNMLLGSDLAGLGGIPGAGDNSQTVTPGLAIAGYDIALMYIKEIQQAFGKAYRVDYRPWSQQLMVVPTPTTSGTGLLSLYRNESASVLYSQPHVKRLAVAKAKKLWGLHLKKYSMTLPGGGTMNGSEIYGDGKEEEAQAIQDMRDESEPIDFMIG